MGASLGSSGGGRGRRNARRNSFNDINITPMVDVMLVLLVIFMVTAPMLTTGVEVNLPKSAAAPLPGTEEKLVISITKDNAIYLGDNKTSRVSLEQLSDKLDAIGKEKKDTQILVHGDTSVDYGMVMKVLGEINRAGLSKVGLQSDPSGIGPDRRS